MEGRRKEELNEKWLNEKGTMELSLGREDNALAGRLKPVDWFAGMELKRNWSMNKW